MTKVIFKKLAEEWIKAAEHDLDWAEGSLKLKKFAGVCFLSQQVVEKSLKAFLYSHGENLKKIHDLDKLLILAIKYAPELERFKIATATLSSYYLQTRYPDIGNIEIFNKKKLAEEAFGWAKEIFNIIKNKIKK
ncbi:MAG: HEPN domain-containing protein [Microgenomates group bacterium]